jgi:hypothetical protein
MARLLAWISIDGNSALACYLSETAQERQPATQWFPTAAAAKAWIQHEAARLKVGIAWLDRHTRRG